MALFPLLPFVLFCFVATGTPGPNNMINLSQGVRFGFRRAMPYALGTGFGIASLLAAVTLGLGAAMTAIPLLRKILVVVTLAFILYLAWKIATAGPPKTDGAERRLGFLTGMGFQWINPKTWATTMTMAATYLPPAPDLRIAALAAAIFCLVSYVTQPVWIGFGTLLRQFLSDPLRARIFNSLMAILLLAATLPVLLPVLIAA